MDEIERTLAVLSEDKPLMRALLQAALTERVERDWLMQAVAPETRVEMLREAVAA